MGNHINTLGTLVLFLHLHTVVASVDTTESSGAETVNVLNGLSGGCAAPHISLPPTTQRVWLR
jgi:hypothetical protein